MLVEQLINYVFTFFSSIFADITLPRFEYFDYVFELINLILINGTTAANVFVPLDYVLGLFGLTLYAEGAVLIYYIIFWILKKFPFLNIH